MKRFPCNTFSHARIVSEHVDIQIYIRFVEVPQICARGEEKINYAVYCSEMITDGKVVR